MGSFLIPRSCLNRRQQAPTVLRLVHSLRYSYGTKLEAWSRIGFGFADSSYRSRKWMTTNFMPDVALREFLRINAFIVWSNDRRSGIRNNEHKTVSCRMSLDVVEGRSLKISAGFSTILPVLLSLCHVSQIITWG